MKLANKLKFLSTVTIIGSGIVFGSGDKIEVSQFSKNSLEGWERKSFSGQTDYQLTEEGTRTVLLAKASSSASGLGKKIRIDLTRTPYINWSWKIDHRLEGLDETTKSGDDYAARLYVVKSGGAFVWKTKALNYVWSSNQPKEVVWPNAFQPKNAKMLSIRGVEDQVGQWVAEKRNVREDLKKVFGKNIETIDAVAIMTDSDNSGRNASAAYGDIFFTAE